MKMKLVSYNQGATPSLRGGVDWINSGPIALSELRGKIVLLRFLDFLLHQLSPRPARPGEARRKI